MRYRVFVDTNILLSGIFFEGNESRILDLVEIDLITSEDNVAELRKVIVKKLRYLKERTLEIALTEADRALVDIDVISRSKSLRKSLRLLFSFLTKKILLSLPPFLPQNRIIFLREMHIS